MAARIGMSDDPLIFDGVSLFVTDESGDPVPLLEDIRLSLHRGEWLNLVGINGSGKSTLARLLGGLHIEGRSGIVVRGYAGESASPIVLQRPEAQLFGETPREEVLFALEWRQVPSDLIESRVQEVLSRTGLMGFADVRWDGLSGGQKQLAAVAAAAACGSPLIVFDEATSMLDEANRQGVQELARALHREGTAIVWVTQRLDELQPEERIVALAGGRITYDGDVRTFFFGESEGSLSTCEPLVHSEVTPCELCGLRLPYMSALALQLRRKGRLSGLLPVTQEEWREVWGNAGGATANGS
jgi:energy-coupling factor transport system ATP-binding protein